MKHWRLEDVAWDRFDPAGVDPGTRPPGEGGRDGGAQRHRLRPLPQWRVRRRSRFLGPPTVGREEVHKAMPGQMGDAGRPGMGLPGRIRPLPGRLPTPLEADASVRGCAPANCRPLMVETGTSSYYTALAEATQEPVLKQVCRHLAPTSSATSSCSTTTCAATWRARTSACCAACASPPPRWRKRGPRTGVRLPLRQQPEGYAYEHARCFAACMAGATGFFRSRHIERGMDMIFRAVGLPPRGRLSGLSARPAWRLMRWRQRRLAARLSSLTLLQRRFATAPTAPATITNATAASTGAAPTRAGLTPCGRCFRPVIIGRTKSCRFSTAVGDDGADMRRAPRSG